ncbi:MAG: nuclear transport factor 2 family protein [Pyrinomonadaceae bacterium]
MKFKILVLLVFVLFSDFAQAQTKPDSKTETELKDLVNQMTDAQIKYDAAALDKVFASDYIEISPVGEFDPREKVLGFYSPEAKAQEGGAPATVAASDFSIRVYDDKFAVVISRFTFDRQIKDQTPRPPVNLRATVVCRKEKGAWKIVTASYTGIRAQLQPPPAAKP